MNNVQKANNCISIASSRTFASYYNTTVEFQCSFRLTLLCFLRVELRTVKSVIKLYSYFKPKHIKLSN
jgi:hypothetical protein